ncbi:DUF4365 domain-containing protein [Amycolatopsis sp. BJA-103]|uniref:DUF4365 domain-containing protein n=1 Tax=Amycolatopsis sp. BJA-103 TaxID=1911175 RepID=UPI000C78B27A|nr:DUF4365 domain-containing protein [Amycolatopsis sp. BJA-103]
MQQPESRQLGAVGEAAAKLAFLRLGWAVIDAAPEHDVGTDLYLEVRDDQLSYSGWMMGAQVKAGASWFDEPRHDESGNIVGWWFRTDQEHVDYWLTHTLPHLVIFHDENADISYWVNITADAAVSTGKGVKIFIPRANTLDGEHRKELFAAARDSGKNYVRRSRRDAIRQADYALAGAIDLLATSTERSPLDVDRRDFRMAFAAELRALRGLTGSPSIATLSKNTNLEIVKIERFLSGEHLPSRWMVGALVHAMAEYARKRGIDIASHEVDVVKWERKWRITKNPGMQKILKNKAHSKAR